MSPYCIWTKINTKSPEYSTIRFFLQYIYIQRCKNTNLKLKRYLYKRNIMNQNISINQRTFYIFIFIISLIKTKYRKSNQIHQIGEFFQGTFKSRELTINCLFSLYFVPPLVRILPHAPRWAGGLTHQLPGLEITDFSAWLGLNIETKHKQNLSVSMEKKGGEQNGA